MLIAGREAVRILQTRGAMPGEAQARGLLRAGAAGPGVIADTGVLFERDAVTELADRPGWTVRPRRTPVREAPTSPDCRARHRSTSRGRGPRSPSGSARSPPCPR